MYEGAMIYTLKIHCLADLGLMTSDESPISIVKVDVIVIRHLQAAAKAYGVHIIRFNVSSKCFTLVMCCLPFLGPMISSKSHI